MAIRAPDGAKNAMRKVGNVIIEMNFGSLAGGTLAS